MIDLHCHSSYSDGLHSPEELFSEAIVQGIKMLALTDHDTLEGIPELKNAAKESHLEIINGIELSTFFKNCDIHIVGLNFSLEHEALRSLITLQNLHRISRAKQIGQKCAEMGIKDAYDKACFLAGHERVGRPHFAKVLVSEGKAVDINSAFKRFLGRGRCLFVPTQWEPIQRVVEIIKEAGGQAVLAHPLKYLITRTRLIELIKTFKEVGGSGLEVVSSNQLTNEIVDLANLCERFELLASTGSDFHGKGMSRTGLGQQVKLPVNCQTIWTSWKGVM